MSRTVLRRLIQGVFAVVILLLIFLSARFIAHQYCPYSVVCFGLRSFNPRGSIRYLPAIIGGIIIIISAVFIGRRFCGYVCPLGTLGEYLNYLNPFRKKLKNRRVPQNVERVGRCLKYGILLFTIAASMIFYSFLYFMYCPSMVFSGINRLVLPGIITVLIFTIGSISIKRFFCRYLCAYAALMNIFQFIGKLLGIKRNRIYRNMEICTDCLICERICQMNISLTDNEYVEDFNCIYCLDCIQCCPKEDCLSV